MVNSMPGIGACVAVCRRPLRLNTSEAAAGCRGGQDAGVPRDVTSPLPPQLPLPMLLAAHNSAAPPALPPALQQTLPSAPLCCADVAGGGLLTCPAAPLLAEAACCTGSELLGRPRCLAMNLTARGARSPTSIVRSKLRMEAPVSELSRSSDDKRSFEILNWAGMSSIDNLLQA